MRICAVEADDLADMIKEIRELDPKPGLSFDSEIVHAVVPDVYVRESSDGGWRVELNSDTLPRVLVNQQYYSEINKNTKSKEDKMYISECYANANWLIKSLDQRAKTILKVATAVVKQQDGFLVRGISQLRPLNLKTIAEAIQMHEFTVSRVTANKYMATPRGVFEMKYFFTSSIASSTGGEAHSAESVRHTIKALIDAERSPGDSFGRSNRGNPARTRDRDRSSNGGQIPGGPEDSLLRAAPPHEKASCLPLVAIASHLKVDAQINCRDALMPMN